MGAQPPEVTLVVVTHDSAQPLRAFFAALSSALADVDGYEIVVADNASRDETVELVAELAPEATVVRLGRNAGYAAGINAAVARARRSRAVLVCNPDVRLHPGAVRCLLDALTVPVRPGAPAVGPALPMPEFPVHEVGIVVPRLVEADGRLSLSLRREPRVLRALGEAVLGGTRAGRFPALGEVVSDPRCFVRPCSADW
ncbi:MAG: glycosyltransferase, partial [Actinomycetota bacterium]|nr:glycosyltransferase [Actinomycetota bacterium]